MIERPGHQPELSPVERVHAAREAFVRGAIATPDGFRGYRAWRNVGADDAQAQRLRQTLETLSAVAPLREEPEFSGVVRDALVHPATSTEALPRSEQLRRAVVAVALGTESPSVRPEVSRVVQSLRAVRTEQGTINAFELLTSAGVDFRTKAEWFERQLLPRLAFLAGRDLEEARAQAVEPPPDDLRAEKERTPEQNVPPPQQGTLTPTMDEREAAREGEPGVWFTIRPFFGGYWREHDYDVWNAQTLEWEQRLPPHRQWQTLTTDATTIADQSSRRVVNGTVRPRLRTSLPMPIDAGFVPDIASLRVLGEGTVRVLSDGRGGYAVAADGDALLSFSMEIGKGTCEQRSSTGSVVDVLMRHPIGAAAEAAIADAARSGGTPYARAQLLKRYVRTTLTYSDDSSFNAVYRGGDPAGYFQRIEEHQQADCDVANTYVARLLAGAGIPMRMVSGHYVKTKNAQGAAVISSGTGHAWVEVWDPMTPGGRDGGWHRFDATPPGDPNMDEEETDEDAGSGEGDFGPEEQEVLSDEELEERARGMEEKPKPTPEQEANIAFAEEAGEGCTPEEAARVRAAIRNARERKDTQGRNIRDRLMRQISRIVQENFKEVRGYRAPVRLSEGDDLEEPVDLLIDTAQGEPDPTGFGREESKEQREQVFGGLDLMLVADKSGSMKLADPSTGRTRWESQQEVSFLAADAIHELTDQFRRHRVRLLSRLDARVGVVVFQGADPEQKIVGGATIVLPLTDQWGPKEQLAVWRALGTGIGGGTPDHLGIAAAGKMVQARGKTSGVDGKTPDVEERARIGGSRVRVVLEYSDGESDDPAAFRNAAAALEAQGIVVAAYRKDLAGFPDFAAEQVIGAVAKLQPKRVRRR